jgi:hypothetical protein
MARLDQNILLAVIARTRRQAKSDRAHDVAELERWFRAELADIREEIEAGRAELQAARLELARYQQMVVECDGGASVH